MSEATKIQTQVCIAGGGPAGMMLGLLMARAGVKVVVLEKHADFLRDFRGDTIHPSTLEVVHELGLLDALLSLPHQKVRTANAQFGSSSIPLADFRHLPTTCDFIAFMPQWDFLNFLSSQAATYSTFTLHLSAEATELLENDGTIHGVRARTAESELEIDADLVVAADGRTSTLRLQSGLVVENLGAPMDVLWFRLERRAEHGEQPLGRFGAGQIVILLNRGDYWQCGYVIPKAAYEKLKTQDFGAFRSRIAQFVPFLRPELDALGGWDDVSLLTVQVNRLKQWYRPGFLCIGDAAHAMSPIAGVGINLAIQDAVAAANLLVEPILGSSLTVEHLRAVQRRREWPTRMTQRLQLVIQNRVISDVLDERTEVRPPLAFRLMTGIPLLRRLPARFIGLGIRREHIETPDVHASLC